MKSITVPYIQGLEGMPSPELSATLDRDGAQGHIDSVNWQEFPYAPHADFRIACSDRYVFIRYSVEEENIRAVCLRDNGPVWEDSCVEFFVQCPGDDHYFNFEANCIGTLLAAKRESKTDFELFTEDRMANVIRYSSLPHREIDRGGGAWTLVLGIPFGLLGLTEIPRSLRANFYKCGDKTASPHFLSWNPVRTETPDFHQPQFFGELVFDF